MTKTEPVSSMFIKAAIGIVSVSFLLKGLMYALNLYAHIPYHSMISILITAYVTSCWWLSVIEDGTDTDGLSFMQILAAGWIAFSYIIVDVIISYKNRKDA